MKISTLFCGLLFGATIAGTGGANAVAVSSTFTFDGQTNVEGNLNNLGPGFPAGGVFRSNGDVSNAVSLGSGADSPDFIFSAGSVSVGEASAFANLRIVVEITNDQSTAQQITWNGLIFAGGTGIIQPDLFGERCSRSELDSCDSFLAPPGSHPAEAALQFGAIFDGADIYGGDIFVDSGGPTANFSNIALTNFRIAPTNSQYYWWDDTAFTIDLGLFAPGETKTLEFFVSTTVSSFGTDGCFFGSEPQQFISCTGAQAGFGDPDFAGGIDQSGISRSAQFFFTSAPPSDVPVPGAVWLFLTGIGALAGGRKLKKRKA